MSLADPPPATDITLRIDDVVDDSGQAIQQVSDYPQQGPDMSIDTTIAPFLTDEPPSPTSYYSQHQHTSSHPSTSSKGFSKGSLTSFLSFRQGSTASLLRSARNSDSGTHLTVPEPKRRSSDDADSVRAPSLAVTASPPPAELRKKSSKFNINLLRRRGSKAHLPQNSQDDSPPPLPSKSDSQHVFNHPVDPPHPLLAHAQPQPPPLPPKEKDKPKEKKSAKGKRGKKGPPEVPPKDEPLYPLDTNLESMEGIVNMNVVVGDPLNPGSPASPSTAPQGPEEQPETSANNTRPTFNNPFSLPSDTQSPTTFGPSRISPTTVDPHVNTVTSTSSAGADSRLDDHDADPPRNPDDGVWKPPESWAVIDQNGLQNGKPEMTAPDDDSSDDEARARRGNSPNATDYPMGALHPPSIHAGGESIKPSRKGKERATPEDSELTVRIYRPNGPNGMYHSVAIGVSLTVYDLLPALHRRTIGDDKHSSRLFLKERGKERILDVRELPLDIIYRRMTEAGYSWNDGLILLSGEHMSFLLKFIYRDPDIGIGRRSFTSDPHNLTFQIQETDLRLDNNFDYVDLTGRSLRAIPVILHQHADQIVSLKLSRNPMIDLPLDFVEACTSLSDLRLSNMSMRKVPANLTQAKSLKRLDLSSNHIKVKELEGGKLHKIPELKALFLQNNLLKDLPTTFSNCMNLGVLNVSNNRLREVPEVVMNIQSLFELDISFNSIESLPENIGDLSQLQRFLFLGNSVVKIPDSFVELRQLEYVDCRRNQIGELGIIMNLPRLEKLYADNNAIHLLDLSMGQNLTKVDISHNEITKVMISLPPSGSRSRYLTLLDISNASLTTLKDSGIDHLTTLVTLKIQHNSLSYLPDTISDLLHLEQLICYENRLQKLPESIGKLGKLTILDAHNNNLREVPETIWDCASLDCLNLSSNFLTTFPPPRIIPLHGQSLTSPHHHHHHHHQKTLLLPKIYNPNHVISGHLYPPLTFSLQYLSISENKLSSSSTLEGLRSITFLRSLLGLNLSYNDITDFPSGFFRGLGKLEEVYCCGNEMTVLPVEDLVGLGELRRLFLSGNKLMVLPAELSRLKKLKMIDVSNNNLRYNINNYEFDWNWNSNEELLYLNLSGNKRFQIKVDNRHTGTPRSSHELIRGIMQHPLSGFASVPHLRNLGLMDVTVTASDLPDETEDRRVRSTASVVGGLGYGVADCLGRDDSMTMLDLVHEFPTTKSSSSSSSSTTTTTSSSSSSSSPSALFAMFGNTSPPKTLPPGISPNKHAKFLHDNFLGFFQNQMDNPDMQESKHLAVDVLRRTFLGLHQMIHNQLFTTLPRKMSVGSLSTNAAVGGTGGGGPTLNVDPVTARSGCSGLVVYIEDRKLFAANVGTALGVISRKGQPFVISKKHCPWNPDELRRMRKSEGWVSPTGLVNDEVDVTRSFGYYHLLPVVHASPDIVEYDITDTDEFLVMGNRGLWDYVSFQTAVDIASGRNDPALVAQKLRDFAMSYGSSGNIMVMVVRLKDVHDKSLVRSSTLFDPSLTFSPTMYTPKNNNGHMVVDKCVRWAEPEVAPPIGHIALVFTDIRNSTHLWEVNPGMPAAIQLHNDLMRRRLRECGGYEFKTEGDAFLCSFPSVMEAVWFCLSVQVQLLQEHWPKEILECEDGQPIRDSGGSLIAQGVSVRMGIHCGAPLCVQDPVTHRMDYLGPVTNRAARVSGVAQGGQIMCSAEVIREIKASLSKIPPQETEMSKFQPAKAIDGVKQLGVVIRDVGERKLKGLEVPEFVSAIYPSGLEARHDLGMEDPVPASVYLNVALVRELGMLCLRLEALTSGRVFKPSLTIKNSEELVMDLENGENEEEIEPWRDLEVDPENVLPPMSSRWTDHDLLMTLDSFICRITNTLPALIKIFEADRIDAPNVMAILQDAGLDATSLALLGELIGHT